MSAGAIRAEARRVVLGAELEPVAETDVLRALDRNANDTPPFLLSVALQAGVDPAAALTRAVAVYFHIAALQVADDIADGDCDYVTPAESAGTIAQFMLQDLGFAVLLDAALPNAILREVVRDFALGASAQSLEVRTKRWTQAETRTTAERFGATHYAAYFRLVLHGSHLEADAARLGRALGIGAAIASDLESSDPRLMTLDAGERAELIAWALGATAAVSGTPLPALNSALDRVELILMREFALLAPLTTSQRLQCDRTP